MTTNDSDELQEMIGDIVWAVWAQAKEPHNPENRYRSVAEAVDDIVKLIDQTCEQRVREAMVNELGEVDRIYKAVRNNSRMILYNDSIGRPDEDGRRDQSLRDDLWAISTEELDVLCKKLTKKGDI